MLRVLLLLYSFLLLTLFKDEVESDEQQESNDGRHGRVDPHDGLMGEEEGESRMVETHSEETEGSGGEYIVLPH